VASLEICIIAYAIMAVVFWLIIFMGSDDFPLMSRLISATLIGLLWPISLMISVYFELKEGTKNN